MYEQGYGVEKDGILDQQRAVGIISAGSHFDEHAQAVAFPKIDAAEGVTLSTVHIETETAAASAGQRDGLDTEVFTIPGDADVPVGADAFWPEDDPRYWEEV